jgi:hypothetical protein
MNKLLRKAVYGLIILGGTVTNSMGQIDDFRDRISNLKIEKISINCIANYIHTNKMLNYEAIVKHHGDYSCEYVTSDKKYILDIRNIFLQWTCSYEFYYPINSRVALTIHYSNNFQDKIAIYYFYKNINSDFNYLIEINGQGYVLYYPISHILGNIMPLEIKETCFKD